MSAAICLFTLQQASWPEHGRKGGSWNQLSTGDGLGCFHRKTWEHIGVLTKIRRQRISVYHYLPSSQISQAPGVFCSFSTSTLIANIDPYLLLRIWSISLHLPKIQNELPMLQDFRSNRFQSGCWYVQKCSGSPSHISTDHLSSASQNRSKKYPQSCDDHNTVTRKCCPMSQNLLNK